MLPGSDFFSSRVTWVQKPRFFARSAPRLCRASPVDLSHPSCAGGERSGSGGGKKPAGLAEGRFRGRVSGCSVCVCVFVCFVVG